MTKAKSDRRQLNKPKLTPFNKVLIEAVNDRLKAILGKPTAAIVLHHLKNIHSLKMEEIPENPASFAAGLENLIGKNAASIIETSIVEELYKKLGLTCPKTKGYSFAEYMKHAKKEHG